MAAPRLKDNSHSNHSSHASHPQDIAQADAWLNLLASAKDEPDQVPPEWKTVNQLAAIWQISRPHAGHLISRLVSQHPDKVELRKFRVSTGTRTYPVPHYRITDAS